MTLFLHVETQDDSGREPAQFSIPFLTNDLRQMEHHVVSFKFNDDHIDKWPTDTAFVSNGSY